MSNLIEVQSVNKTYQRGGETLVVLDDLNLEVPKGDYLALMGPSGSGKSTLLSVITDANQKLEIMSLQFKPNLGIVKYKDFNTFVVSDIPGIIKGASKGKGLGHHFLRHIERNSILVFLVSCESQNIDKKFNILVDELRKYNKELLNKEKFLVVTKCDLLGKDDISELISNPQGQDGASLLDKAESMIFALNDETI